MIYLDMQLKDLFANKVYLSVVLSKETYNAGLFPQKRLVM